MNRAQASCCACERSVFGLCLLCLRDGEEEKQMRLESGEVG